MRISWVDESEVSCGGIPISLENLESLKNQGIRAIVTLTERPLTTQKAITPEILAEMDFDFLHVPVVDQHPPTQDQARQVYRFVQKMRSEKRPVYLHCHAGVGRTGTLLHAVSLLSGMNLDDVKEKIKQKRPSSQFFMLADIQKEFLEQFAEELRS